MAATDPGAAVGSQPAEPPFGDGDGFGGSYGGGNGNGYGGYGGDNGYGGGYRYGESGDTHTASGGLGPETDPIGAGADGNPEDLTTPSRGGGRRAARARPTKRRRIPAWLEILGYVVISLTLTSLIKTFLVQMYYIPSPSMEPTTYKGDRVFVDKLSTWVGGAPARDQVIVFHDPHNWLMSSVGSTGGAINLPDILAAVGILPDQHDDLLIKRIIGVAGDTIECKTQDGPVYRDGVALDESSFIMNGKQGMPCYNGTYKVTVPAGNLWVLGDNREHSGDSSWNYLKKGGDAGFVPTKNVVGHVVGVVSWLRDDHPAGS
ncbi:signal peptidase I [Catenulispora rubra]|uniref:signal peptidase I n=1 Tax=Catenulispora rubra TaxID=280293 RepID=UPI0018920EF4|nr:signal peptidase I [Catenulispora rubra]